MERTRASTAPARRGDRTHPAPPRAPAGLARIRAAGRNARRTGGPVAAGLLAAVVGTAVPAAASPPPGPAASALPAATAPRLVTGTAPASGGALASPTGPTRQGRGGDTATAPGRPAGPVTAASPGPSLELVRQPWTVGPGQAFTATVAVSGARASGLDVTVTVYSRLHTRTALSQTLAGTVSGVATFRSDPVPLSSLPGAGSGRYQVTVDLRTPDGPTPGTPTGGVAAGPSAGGASASTPAGASPPAGTFGPAPLGCAYGRPGTCGGVYPVEIQVGPARGAPTADLVTEMVYAYPAGNPYHATSPLRVALVVPLTVTAATGQPPAGAVSQLARMARAVSSPPSMPLTVVPEPAALGLLGRGGSAADRQAVTAVQAAADDPAHQVVSEGYVPVDAGALVDAGLGGELAQQISRACQELVPPRSSVGTWVSDAPLGTQAAGALASQSCDPVRRLVVPASAVTGGGCSITCTAPFTVTGVAGGEITAIESDSQLASEITEPAPDPALRAHQLLADLSLTYFEAPTPAQPRGVVLAIPSGAAVAPGEVADLVAGVLADPALLPVTLSQLFAQVPVGANGQPASRHLVGAGGSRGLPVQAIRTARARLDAYAAAVSATPAGQQEVTVLGAELLRAESSDLRPVEQRRAVAGFERSLGSELGRITLSAGDVRLTSSSVLRVPITLGSTTGFPVSGTLTVSSDKLLFTPGGQCAGTDRGPAGFTGVSCDVVLSKATNTVYVSMRARIGGDFRVAVTFDAPGGTLAMLRGQMTVRSLSTSVEAVALSVAAGVVLLLWWARTGWRGRRRARHGRRSRAAAAEPLPAAGHEHPAGARPGPATRP